MKLKNKNIILGVTGGIAAYKSLELVRLLVKEGANVTPILTKSACEFITPLSISVLSGNEALTEMFDLTKEVKISHIDMADETDLILVAPTTANTIGQIAGGLSPDLLTTVILATKAPVVICPAMNDNMFDNDIVAENIKKLKSHGYKFVDPEAGMLACGHVGMGRLANLDIIVEAVTDILVKGDLAGERVLITAGPLREAIDPVRYITNGSSGKMGYKLAEAALRRGAAVTLISGPVSLTPPKGVSLINVNTAGEMHKAVTEHFEDSTVTIMSAAVSDYRPEVFSETKIKKNMNSPEDVLTLPLVKTRDILKELGRRKGDKVLVGFALETEDLIENAKEKLKTKNLDLVVANNANAINSDRSTVIILDCYNDMQRLEDVSKDKSAEVILDKVVELKNK